MKPTPPGWPRISSSLFYDEPRAAIDWLGKAFGFEVRLLVEGDGGRVEHSELTFGEGVGTITDVAYQYGFTNPGRFAGLYKRAFGVFPAEDLRRSPARRARRR